MAQNRGSSKKSPKHVMDDLNRLQLALEQTPTFSVHILVHKPGFSLQKELERITNQLNKKLIWISIEKYSRPFFEILTSLPIVDYNSVICLTGIEGYLEGHPEIDLSAELEVLNRNFYLFREKFKFPLLIHIPPYMVQFFQEFAPDFWQWRKGFYVLEKKVEEKFPIQLYLQDFFFGEEALLSYPQKEEWLEVYSALQWESGFTNLKMQTAFEAQLFGLLGRCRFQLGQFRHALDYFRKQKEYITNQKDKSALPEVLNNMALSYHELGNPQIALEFIQEAEQIAEDKLRGANHPFKAIIASNMSRIWLTLGNSTEAFLKGRHAVRIFEKKMGMRHPGLIPILLKFGKAQTALEKFGEALDTYRRVLQLVERVWEFEHPYMSVVLQHIAMVYYHQKKYEAARRYFYRTMERIEAALGPEHPYVAHQLFYIGAIHKELGHTNHALDYFNWALQIRQKNPGGNDPLIGELYRSIAELYYQLQDHDKAEEYLQKALKVFHSSLPPNHPSSMKAEEQLHLMNE
ncbi:MAG: tetratricopeptide repeat protein [Calditrichaeota bacterium]|nr:MAG: tetratricopeptide repeat protein [Calditrichota bacterium]